MLHADTPAHCRPGTEFGPTFYKHLLSTAINQTNNDQVLDQYLRAVHLFNTMGREVIERASSAEGKYSLKNLLYMSIQKLFIVSPNKSIWEPNAYIIQISSTRNRNVTLALKCMAKK